MSDKYIYRGKEYTVKDASGVAGVLIKTFSGGYAFRVYDNKGKFVDYDLRHDDLAITIDTDSLASFYANGDKTLLDHNPRVLNLKKIDSPVG